MSRYSRIFLRPKASGSLTAESSKYSTTEPASSSSPGYSYPPSSSQEYYSTVASQAASPPPHPYTLAVSAFHTSDDASTREGTSTVSHVHGQRMLGEFSTISEKPLETSLGHAGFPTITRPTNVSRRNSRFYDSPIPAPLHQRPAVLFVLFLPLPPLLSLLYLLTGHAILRRTNPSPTSIFNVPLLASVETGATGGIILSIPLALLFFILLVPSTPPPAPEDFFEDDSSSMLSRARWTHYAKLTLCALLVVCIGAIAGPLGVTCLSGASASQFVQGKKMLSTSAAAEAGIVGGAVLVCGLLALCVGGLTIWTCSRRASSKPSYSPS